MMHLESDKEEIQRINDRNKRLEQEVTTLSEKEIRQRFGPWRAPTKDTLPKYKVIHDMFLDLALTIDKVCPNSIEKKTALTMLNFAKMSANSSIAIHSSTKDIQ